MTGRVNMAVSAEAMPASVVSPGLRDIQACAYTQILSAARKRVFLRQAAGRRPRSASNRNPACCARRRWPAHAHHGGAFLDGDLVVARHAHRQLVQPDACGRVLAQPVAQRAQQHETLAHALGLGREQRQRHEAAHPQAGIGRHLCRRKAAASSGCRPYLLASPEVLICTYIQRAALGLQAAVQRLGHAQAVQRLELGRVARHQLGLVGLQMADDGPAQVRQVGHGLPFARHLLQLVLAQVAAAGLVGQADARLVHRLAHRQQAHAVRRAPGAAGRVGDALVDRGQVAAEILHRLGARPAPC